MFDKKVAYASNFTCYTLYILIFQKELMQVSQTNCCKSINRANKDEYLRQEKVLDTIIYHAAFKKSTTESKCDIAEMYRLLTNITESLKSSHKVIEHLENALPLFLPQDTFP